MMRLNLKYYVSRSLRKDRATVAAVSFVRLRCFISARATGKVVQQDGSSSAQHTYVAPSSLFTHSTATSWNWWSSSRRKTNSTWCLRSSEEVSAGAASRLVDFQRCLYRRKLRLSCPPIRIHLGSHSQETPLQRAGSQCGCARDCQCSRFPA